MCQYILLLLCIAQYLVESISQSIDLSSVILNAFAQKYDVILKNDMKKHIDHLKIRSG